MTYTIFFFNDTATTEIYTLSLHDALPIFRMPPTHTDEGLRAAAEIRGRHPGVGVLVLSGVVEEAYAMELFADGADGLGYLLKDRKSTRLNSSHANISYAVFCLKKKNTTHT